MDTDQPNGSIRKRSLGDENRHLPRKKTKLLPASCQSELSALPEMSGWQAALGASLADHLERLTVQRNLTARQVKKLLRAVLTNEDVVSAFRRYINLSEPETGEMSASTRRQAKALGLLPSSSGDQVDPTLEPRVITRSLARSIRCSLRDYLPSGASDPGKKRSTILEMEFPNEEEDDGAARTPRTLPSESVDQDEDYQPGPSDWCLLERDRALDAAPTCLSQSLSDASVSRLSYDGNSTQSASAEEGAVPECSTYANGCYQPPERSSVVTNFGTPKPQHRSDRIHWTGNQQPLSGGVSDHESSLVENEVDADRGTSSTPLSRSTGESPNNLEDGVDEKDDDDVYAEFLRSLFAPCESTQAVSKLNDTLCTSSDGPNRSHHHMSTHPPSMSPSCVTTSKYSPQDSEDDGDDDPNDPEFDVMAELDKVDREDFIDELRDDRAVRVSKMEAKSLHQDLRDLFSDEDDQDDGEPSATDKPSASAVFAMRSQCHRLLTAQRALKSEPPDLQNQSEHRDERVSREIPSHPSDTRIPRLFAQINSLSLTTDESLQLRRQIAMHIQLLTTNFICSYDFPHLHATVTRTCASALKELASRRDAFDLMAQQRIGSDAASSPIHSCYWSCPCLDDAVQLITEYAGLSIMPRIPKPIRRTEVSSTPYSNSPLPENQKRSSLRSLPLPSCLIRLMLSNPIWSYPFLMPAGLPALHEPSNLWHNRRRVAFHSSEDALILLGLADFCSPSSGPSSVTYVDGDHQSGHGRYLTYRLVRKHLLPHRNLLQLRTRRWNLLSNRAVMKRKFSINSTPTPTRCLLRLYSDVLRGSPLDRNLLHSLADEVATSSIPRHIPLRFGCLSSMAPEELFGPHCLPANAGYEAVLLNLTSERSFRGEMSKRIHDILTDFVQHAECLWWSNGTNATPYSNTSKTEPVNLYNTLDEAVLKPEESDANLLAPPVLGPTFLPALPVELTPDGTVLLNTRREPTLIELHTTGRESDIPRNSGPPTITNVSKYVKHINPIDQTGSSITEHVEALLSRIRSQASNSSRSVSRRLNSTLTIRTIAPLSNAPIVAGKLPLPPLRTSTDTVAKRLVLHRYKKRPTGRRPKGLLSSTSIPQSTISPLCDTTATVTSTINTAHTSISSTSSSKICPYKRIFTSAEELGLIRCQKYVDSLIKQFHFGMDKLVNARGTSVFGSMRFPPLSGTSLLHTSDPSPPPPQPAQDDYLTAPVERWITQQQSQQISVFPTSCLLTAGRFLNRCKARGEATSTDLLTLPSSTALQRQSATDEHDVHRARSILDRCRAYLSPADYGTIVFALRRLNQLVHSSNSAGLTPTQCKKHILTGLISILDKLKSHPSLWDDFVCLLTADQAQQLGLLSTYLDLIRVNRVQRILQDLVPRGKRFWRRLRNLADSCADTRRPPADKANNNPNLTGTNSLPSSATTSTPPKGRRKPPKRNKVRFPIPKTWALLESTWRNRPVLMSQLACLLNITHKPYSGFDQSFEEIDLLTRQPLGKPNFVASETASETTLSPALVDPFAALSGSEDGWEVCTVLSAAAKHRGFKHTSNQSQRNCPCLCHPASTVSTSGKSSKAGSRHCISCSLRVHRGIVYVGECSIRLRPVHITWPPGFKPKTSLLPSSTNKVSLRSKAKQILHCRYGIIHWSGYSSTRATLAQLAQLHARSNSTDFENDQLPMLPDMARRHVAIEYVPSVKLDSITQQAPSHTTNALIGQDAEFETPVALATDDSAEFCSADSAPGSPLSPPQVCTTPAHWFIDDDAACFNTEAFASSSNSIVHQDSSPKDHGNSISDAPGESDDSWNLEEDRQLLEYTKSRGIYRTSMFDDLAKCWVPKPFPTSRLRRAPELEARFKRLMQLTLGEAYDPILFRSPERDDFEND